MQIIRRYRSVVAGLLGMALVSAQPLHAQTSGDATVTDRAVCYVKLLGDVLVNPLTSGARYAECIERASQE